MEAAAQPAKLKSHQTESHKFLHAGTRYKTQNRPSAVRLSSYVMLILAEARNRRSLLIKFASQTSAGFELLKTRAKCRISV